jgi:hypothetical protein
MKGVKNSNEAKFSFDEDQLIIRLVESIGTEN